MTLTPDGDVAMLYGHRFSDAEEAALTEHSLVEAAQLAGLRTRHLIVRFLPYTSKGRLPAHPMLVRAYLALRPAWLLLGRQTFYVGERPG